MIEVGESTGALPQMLNSVAEFFEEDVQTALTAALSLIEPVILIVMGVGCRDDYDCALPADLFAGAGGHDGGQMMKRMTNQPRRLTNEGVPLHG